MKALFSFVLFVLIPSVALAAEGNLMSGAYKNTRPACTELSGNRGRLWAEDSGSGTVDKLYQCQKDAADAYAWVQLPFVGGTVTSLDVDSLTFGTADGDEISADQGTFTILIFTSAYGTVATITTINGTTANITDVNVLDDLDVDGDSDFQGANFGGLADFDAGVNIGGAANMEIDYSGWWNASLNFGAIAECETLTFAAPGAVTGDQCSWGTVIGSYDVDLQFNCFMTTDTAHIRACCHKAADAACADPSASGWSVRTFRR